MRNGTCNVEIELVECHTAGLQDGGEVRTGH